MAVSLQYHFRALMDDHLDHNLTPQLHTRYGRIAISDNDANLSSKAT